MFGPGYVACRTGKYSICFAPITWIAFGGMGEWCLLKNSVREKAWPKTGQKSSHAKMPMNHESGAR
jgi:hypothetical protein